MLKDIAYSVLWNKCPACHQTPVFRNPNPYNLSDILDMNTTCSCCHENYEKEPGFFYGAMYVSYALTVGWFLITWLFYLAFLDIEMWQYLVFAISTILLFFPLTFRLSRLIWLNFFIRFDANKAKPTII